MNSKKKDVLPKFLPVNIARGSLHWVHITHITNPHNFYVRPTSSSYFLNDEMADNLTDALRHDTPQIGDIITYKSTQSSSKVRGQIIYILDKDDTCLYDIFAIDYGFTDKNVTPDDIWACDSNYSQIPPLVYNCELEFCSPIDNEWSQESIDAFKFYVRNEQAHLTIRGMNDSKLIVQLINTTENIAKIMALTNYSRYVCVSNDISRISQATPKKLFYKQKIINVDDRLHITVLTGRTLHNFFVAEKTDYAKYKNEIKEMLKYAQYERPMNEEDVEENMPVLVTLNCLEFERGLIKEITIPNSKVLVELVDLGKTVHAPFWNLRAISDPLLSYPIALNCCAVDTQVWDNCLHRLLMPGNEFLITITKLKQKSEPFTVTISLVK